MDALPLRLKPGCDLRRALEEAVLRDGMTSAFVVSGIGSLANATLRMAGAESETQLTGLFEIVSLSGTISPDGAHLHMAVSDSTGRVCGGHVSYGNEVRTTAEVLLRRCRVGGSRARSIRRPAFANSRCIERSDDRYGFSKGHRRCTMTPFTSRAPDP